MTAKGDPVRIIEPRKDTLEAEGGNHAREG